ncbi:MAG: EutN/CcmL family microcompartment protein [Planctomycetota bacterium]
MPQLGRVIGTLWCTHKHPKLEGAKLQILQPLDAQQKASGTPIACVDTVGAGPGEMVFYVTAYEAVIPYSMSDLVPIDASIIGIVEQLHWVPPSGENS